MRLHHIFIALIIFSLFTVVLYSETKNLYGEHGFNMSESDYLEDETSGNASALFTKLNVITGTKDNITDMAQLAPGGGENSVTGESETTEGTMQKSGLGLVASAGQFLFSIPKLVISEVANFFHIDSTFPTVAITILILIVAIILVSSILRNRL